MTLALMQRRLQHALFVPITRMKDKFDYYDAFAVILPGLVAMLCVAFMLDAVDDWDKYMKISLGSSLLVCVLAFLVGDVIQTVAKLLEACFWKIFYDGKPTVWIADEQPHALARWIRSMTHPVLPNDDIQTVKLALKETKALTKGHISRNFNSMKLDAWLNPDTKNICSNHISKANMYRGFSTIAFAVCIYALWHIIPAVFNQTVGVDMRDITSLACGLAALLLFGYRFVYFSIKYSQTFLAGFVKAWRKNNPDITKASKLAKGVS